MTKLDPATGWEPNHLVEPATDLFLLPEYAAAFSEFMQDGIQGLARAQDPILATMPRRRSKRSYQSRNSMPSGVVLDSAPIIARWQLHLVPANVAEGAASTLMSMLEGMAQNYVREVMPQIFASLATVSTAAGTQVDAAGRPFSAELLAEALEKMEIDFDDDGTPRIQLVVGTDMTIPENTEEGQRIIDAVIERKRQQFFAQRRHRQLPHHPLGG